MMPVFLHIFLARHVHNLALGRRLAVPGVAALVIGSQLFWAWELWRGVARRLGGRWRWAAAALALAWYAQGFALTFDVQRGAFAAVELTPGQALFAAPFQVWLLGSILVFPFLAIFRLAAWARRSPSPGRGVRAERRQFLRGLGSAAVAAPFAIGAYGVVRGRLEIETTAPRIALPGLPAGFHGFRIAQLSDLHISPFMSVSQIQRVADQVNALRPDLIVLTGDFVTWDGSTQIAVVAALSGLRAPFGVYGCLGNHELYTGVESSITELFRLSGATMLRQAAATIEVPAVGGRGAPAALQLLGVDYPRHEHRGQPGDVQATVARIAPLVRPDLVNVLLAHHPNCFDPAAELGIALTVSGHTHGGQIALVSPEFSPAAFVTPYISGHFRQGGSQLYVNRGIGTIGVPMRLFAPPEITVFTLARGA